MNTYIKHHCYCLDIAMPYKNPVLDGRVIKQSMERVLKNNSENDVFQEIKIIKTRYPKLKIQLVSYQEQILEYGLEQFVKQCKESYIDYFLSPNADSAILRLLDEEFNKYDIPVIRFAGYNPSKDNLEQLKKAKGFLFQQSNDGLTGSLGKISPKLAMNISKYREQGISIPIYVGFGISSKEHVEDVINSGADGVIIGSALFDYFEKKALDQYLKQFDEYFNK